MTTTHPRPGHPEENLGEFAEELRLLAEAVLERVEPVLRRTAADGRVEWSSCSWCPVCAAAAIVRGEHHDVVAAIADHGTAIVTVLREALAGVPVEPVIPPDLDPDSPEYHAWHHYSRTRTGERPFADAYAAARGGADPADSAGGDSEFTGGDSEFTGGDSEFTGGGESAESHAAHGPGTNLSAVFARFLAGMQGHAASAKPARHHTSGAEDPLGHGPGAARSPGAARTGTRRTFDTPAGPVGPPGGMPFGPPVAAPASDAVRPDPAASADSGSAPGGTRPGAGRRAKRAKYVPIDVNIKA